VYLPPNTNKLQVCYRYYGPADFMGEPIRCGCWVRVRRIRFSRIWDRYSFCVCRVSRPARMTDALRYAFDLIELKRATSCGVIRMKAARSRWK